MLTRKTVGFLYYDLKHSLLNFSSFFFLLILPVGFYLLFGVMQDYGDYPVRDGNAAAYVMLGMAVYGAVNGAVAASGSAVVEITSGWGRQLALTPLRNRTLIAVKIIGALITTALPVLAVNLVALFTSAKIPPAQQVASALITVVAASIFSFYGVAFALMFKNARAVSVASGLLIFFSFFGTAFSPLPEDLMPYARFTPLYGLTSLARYPFTHGETIVTGSDSLSITEPLHWAVINLICWAALFIGSTVALRPRMKTR